MSPGVRPRRELDAVEPDRHLREPVVIDEAIREHRELWVMLYRASLGFDVRESQLERLRKQDLAARVLRP